MLSQLCCVLDDHLACHAQLEMTHSLVTRLTALSAQLLQTVETAALFLYVAWRRMSSRLPARGLCPCCSYFMTEAASASKHLPQHFVQAARDMPRHSQINAALHVLFTCSASPAPPAAPRLTSACYVQVLCFASCVPPTGTLLSLQRRW